MHCARSIGKDIKIKRLEYSSATGV